MAGPKRSHAQVISDRLKVADWYLKGWTQQEIADQLGLTQPQVSYDLRILYQQWQTSALLKIDKAKARELARIDKLERTYWQAWENSLREQVIHGEKTVTGALAREESSERRTELLGDPRFLEGIRWCIQRRCAILGIDAPTKVAPTTPEGDQPYDGSGVSADQFSRGLSTLAEALGRVLSQAGAGGDGAVDAAERPAVDGPAEPGG